MSVAPETPAAGVETPATRDGFSAPCAMSKWRWIAMVVALSAGCLAASYGSNYLLGAILDVPESIGIPLVPVVAALVWLLPVLIAPSLRDVGSFRFPLTSSVLLLVPIIALNWRYSLFFATPVLLPWDAWLRWGGKGMAQGVFEELVFRGYAFRRAPEARPRFVVVTTAICFGLAHVAWLTERPVEAVLSNVSFALVIGLALGAIRLISGSLAWCMLLHGLIDAATPVAGPGLIRWTPYLMALVAAASAITLWCHPMFRRGDAAGTQIGRPETG